jgi:uncharacterized protein
VSQSHDPADSRTYQDCNLDEGLLVILKTFRWAFGITLIGLLAAYLYAGVTGLAVAAILIVLEISLSFDNAVVNARVLGRMSSFWQQIFLTVGIVIAVFGMRLVFPFVVVGVSAQLSPGEAWTLAMAHGDPQTAGSYGYILAAAHPTIAAFGGIFLLMIFLNFLFEEEKEYYWLTLLERPLHKLGGLNAAAIIISLSVLLVFAYTLVDDVKTVLTAGLIGMLTYLLVDGLGQMFAGEADEVETDGSAGSSILAVGKSALFLFLYLEVLDASFSFDGVIGAFAITADPIIIALGLGVGAIYVRSLTVFLVRKGTLSDYVYLEHGAHWAIGALAILLLFTMHYEIPEVVTGLIGVGFIGAAFWWSVRRNRRLELAEQEETAALLLTHV